MQSLTLHVPRHFPYKAKLSDFINNNALTIKHLHERFASIHVYGAPASIEKLIEYIKQYADYRIYPVINTGPKKSYLKNNSQPHMTSAFNARDMATIYNIDGKPTQRVNIAIIELGGGYNVSDLQTYWNYLELKIIPNVTSISVDGTTNNPGIDINDDKEVVLDIEIIGGICPNSNIYVYFAPNSDTGFYNAIHSAIYNNTYPVNVISVSWGAAESRYDINTLNAFNDLFAQAAQRNITICVATGDSGSSDGENGLHVDFPASSPWVLACGGTKLICPQKIYVHNSTLETVWRTSAFSSTGGGFSSIFDAPSYQLPSLIQYKPGQALFKRGIPDVCGLADPATGWIIYFRGEYCIVGGTSAVAPMWAAYLASINYAKFLNPNIYNNYQINKNIVHDIKNDNNGEYVATLYWDPASGLGSPNGSILTPLLNPNSNQPAGIYPHASNVVEGTCCSTA
jgi:kumamolisin